jgi:hypothetical protein
MSFLLKFYMHFVSLPCVLLAPFTTFHNIILGLITITIRNETYKLCIMYFFSSLLLLPPSWIKIYSSTPCSYTPPIYIPAWRWDTNFHTLTKQLVKLYHCMERPQVADGGKSSRYGGQMRIYWISSRGHSTRGGPPAWVLGVGLTIPHRKNFLLLRNVLKRLGPELILWHGLSNGKRTWDLVLGTLGLSVG